MNEGKIRIEGMPTGIPGLDEVLGGEGLPEYSFNLIAGGPGSGKTTLVQQLIFHNATVEQPAIYFTVLGEPPLKMLRYQQQFSFFDSQKVNRAVRFVNLSREALCDDFKDVLATIVKEVEKTGPRLVAVDSFRTLHGHLGGAESTEVRRFIQHLALHLSSWQATTFLIGEYADEHPPDTAIFTVADGVLWLRQSVDRNSSVRKLQVTKMRGRAPMPGLHTFRITDDGVGVFPRLLKPGPAKARRTSPPARVSVGVPLLDEMMAGGIPEGDSVLIAGPAGSGKTVLSTQFIASGVMQGEPGVIAIFEEHPDNYMARAKSIGYDLERMVDEGKLRIIYLRPLDLSVDETLQEVQESVRQLGAKRVVVDSLSGFELALAPTFRDDFRESLYRMVGLLTGLGVTVLMTVEVMESFAELSFSPHSISFLTDVVILQRYAEIESRLQKVITVIKMRNSSHSKDLRAYEVGEHGIEIGETLEEYRGLIGGIPVRVDVPRSTYPDLTVMERGILETLIELGEATVADIAHRSALDEVEVARVLSRLVGLNHAIALTAEEERRFRPIGRPLT